MTRALATDSSTTAARLVERFQRLHGHYPQLFRAPGRVNLIGEHTDYNDGFVMPAAIGLYTSVAIGPRQDGKLDIYSEQFGDQVQLSIDDLSGPPLGHWSDYVRGVAGVLCTAGHEISGANLVIAGEVPLGAGLSSSASLEVATAFALVGVSGLRVSSLEIVKLCQKAEHEYTGTLCGIMDQFVSVFGMAEHALMLDCRSLDYTLVPVPDEVRVVICNSNIRHELAGGEYNQRRADCQAAVATLSKWSPWVAALRDVRREDVERYRSELPDVVYRRARHVVTENERVCQASAALTSGDVSRFGQLMYASHASLRDDYQVSCEELDLLVEIASDIEGVYGSRMTGGGFGGCTVSLVKAEAVNRFKGKVRNMYEQKTGKICPIYVCTAAEGAARNQPRRPN